MSKGSAMLWRRCSLRQIACCMLLLSLVKQEATLARTPGYVHAHSSAVSQCPSLVHFKQNRGLLPLPVAALRGGKPEAESDYKCSCQFQVVILPPE